MIAHMSRISNLFRGAGFFFKGCKYLWKNPKLWPWAIMPTVINLLLLAIMLGSFFHFYGDIYAWLSSHLGGLTISTANTWYLHILNGILWFFDIFFQLLIVLISLIFLMIISYCISFIVAAPFNDMLSEKVEILITGETPPKITLKKFMSDMMRVIKIESIKAAILLIIPVFLFIFNIIPVIGGTLYVIFTFTFGAWDLGFAYADLPMGRKVLSLKKRWDYAKKNKYFLIGFGWGFIIPFFALVFAAPMVVGGTMLYFEHHTKN